MSEHLKVAKDNLHRAIVAQTPSEELHLTRVAMWGILNHLEAQEAAAAEMASPSATPSSADTETQEATKPTWSTSRTWSYLVSPGGKLEQYQRVGIAAWLSLLRIPGNAQEVEIGVTLTSKATTSPSGSASLSTPPPPESVIGSSSRSGAPGVAAGESPSRSGRDCEHDYASMGTESQCVKCGAEANVASPQADAPSPTGSSKWQVYHATTCPRHLRGTLFTKASDCTCGLDEWLAVKDGVRDKPARPQWPEPEPGEDAWTLLDSNGSRRLFAPGGDYLFSWEDVQRYLNALYRGEVGPRDRWPS